MEQTLAKLRRLQTLTLLALLATLAVVVADRLRPRPAPTAPPPVQVPVPGPAVDLGPLEKRVSTLEDALRTAAKTARVVNVDKRYLVRIWNDRRGLFADVVERPFTEATDVAVADGAAPAGGAEPVRLEPKPGVRIAVARDLGPVARGGHGLLAVQALVRTNNGIREDAATPHRLALACVERDGAERQLELAGDYFKVVSEFPTDALLKTAANTNLFLVTEGARIELVVDAAALARDLAAGGRFDVLVRLGPLVAFDGAAAR